MLKAVSESDWDDLIDKDKKFLEDNLSVKEREFSFKKPEMVDRGVQALMAHKNETFEAFLRERGLKLTSKEFQEVSKIYPFVCLCLSKEINSNVKVALNKEVLITWEQIKKGDTFLIKIYHLLLISRASIKKGIDLIKLIIEWAYA
jgi:hypothetical protein